MAATMSRHPQRRSNTRHEERSTISLSQFARMVQAGYSVAGVSVDQDSAMRHDAVWSCVTKKAQDVAMLPADVVRYTDGRRVEVSPAPQIITAPSVQVPDSMDWRYQVLVSWLTAGRAWGIVTSTSPDYRYPTRIELLNDADVTVMQNGERVTIYVHGVERTLWPAGDLWYQPAYTVPGRFLGLSPIAYHARTIGVGLAAEKFAADFFDGGGHPSGVFQFDTDPGPDVAKDFKQAVMAVTNGNRDPLVLPASVKFEQLQVNPDDSAFIDTQKYTVEQICRIFDEDPADHGASGGGSSLTYANRSDSDLARYKRRQFWITKLQNVLGSMLPPGQAVKLNTSALLMMTAKERHELHKLRLDSKTRTINEVRRLEDEAPFDGAEYDEPGVPDGSTDEAEIERQAVILQKMYLSVGVILTPDEARDMARKAGIELPASYDPALLGKKPQAPQGGAT